jgi:hypothetical protein
MGLTVVLPLAALMFLVCTSCRADEQSELIVVSRDELKGDFWFDPEITCLSFFFPTHSTRSSKTCSASQRF